MCVCVQIRFQGYSLTHPNPYPHSFAAFSSIYSNSGFRGLYQGATPTIARAAILTGSQLSSYDHSKRLMLRSGMFQDTPMTHFIASVISGLVTTTACNPVDVIKTRIMMDGTKGLYANPIDCLVKTVTREGPAALSQIIRTHSHKDEVNPITYALVPGSHPYRLLLFFFNSWFFLLLLLLFVPPIPLSFPSFCPFPPLVSERLGAELFATWSTFHPITPIGRIYSSETRSRIILTIKYANKGKRPKFSNKQGATNSSHHVALHHTIPHQAKLYHLRCLHLSEHDWHLYAIVNLPLPIHTSIQSQIQPQLIPTNTNLCDRYVMIARWIAHLK